MGDEKRREEKQVQITWGSGDPEKRPGPECMLHVFVSFFFSISLLFISLMLCKIDLSPKEF